MSPDSAALLERHFDTAFASLEGVARLRELILTLAMQGKLVEQDPTDQPASELLAEIELTRRHEDTKGRRRRRRKELPPVSEEEKPYDIPGSWEWVRLVNIGEINPKNECDDSIKVAFVPMALIPEGFSENHKTENRMWRDIKKGYTHFADGDVGMAKITPCFENRKSCIFKNLTNGVGAGTTELHVFRNTYNAIIPRFLLFYIKNPQFIARAVPNMTGTAGQKRVPTPYFSGHPFPLPPLLEQHRIVTKIDELMARCDALEALHQQQQQKRLEVHTAAIQRLLDQGAQDPALDPLVFLSRHFQDLYTVPENVGELRQAILQLAVTGRLVPQDPSDPSADQLLEQIKVTKERLIEEKIIKRQKILPSISLGEVPYKIPNTWKWERLGNLANFIDYRGKTPKKTNFGIPLITAKNIRFGFINREPREFIKEEDYKSWMTRGIPQAGDLLFTTEAPLGNVAVIDIKEPFALAQRAICFSLYEHALSVFMKWSIMSPLSQQIIRENATGMTAKGIKAARLKELLFPVPPLPEQHRIVAKVDELMSLCDHLDEQINARQQKQTQLLDALMAQI